MLKKFIELINTLTTMTNYIAVISTMNMTTKSMLMLILVSISLIRLSMEKQRSMEQ